VGARLIFYRVGDITVRPRLGAKDGTPGRDPFRALVARADADARAGATHRCRNRRSEARLQARRACSRCAAGAGVDPADRAASQRGLSASAAVRARRALFIVPPRRRAAGARQSAGRPVDGRQSASASAYGYRRRRQHRSPRARGAPARARRHVDDAPDGVGADRLRPPRAQPTSVHRLRDERHCRAPAAHGYQRPRSWALPGGRSTGSTRASPLRDAFTKPIWIFRRDAARESRV
jgi:hypothetical protein